MKVFGLQNAIHIMMKRPVKEIFNYLIEELKISFDEIDNEGLNPVYIGIKLPYMKTSIRILQPVMDLGLITI